MGWPTKDKGRVYSYPNDECRLYGRDFCFNCIQDNYDYVEKRQREEKEPKKPSWFWKYSKTQLNQQDINFLLGITPTGWKPFKRRK